MSFPGLSYRAQGGKQPRGIQALLMAQTGLIIVGELADLWSQVPILPGR